MQACKLRSDGEAQLSTPFPALPRRIHRRTHHRLRREGMTMRPRYRDGCEGESPISEPGWTVVSLTSTAPKTLSHKGCMMPARRPSDAGLTYVLPGGRWRASRSKHYERRSFRSRRFPVVRSYDPRMIRWHVRTLSAIRQPTITILCQPCGQPGAITRKAHRAVQRPQGDPPAGDACLELTRFGGHP